MSRFPQRKERDCLNCRTQLVGNFCHNCGQENIHPKQSVWHLVSHFFKDITHFDGKFFTTLKQLIRKPGYLSKEFISGRRASYVDPVRMYLFTSAFFFLIFFSVYKVDENSIKVGPNSWGATYAELEKMDSVKLNEFTKKMNKGKTLTLPEIKEKMDKSTFSIGPGNYKSKREYDSVLKAGGKKHNWIEKQLVYKNLDLQEKYNSDGKQIIIALINKFMHLLPQMLFVLLPLFALILKLVYIRRRDFYYVDHIIFTIHLYIFVFLVMLVTFGISKLRSFTDWNWLGYISGILVICIFFYFYKALRNFYKQRRAKTILKYFILLLSFLVITVFMFIVFFFFSIFGL